MACVHCGIEVTNYWVIMKDDSICCYTCGRLRADQRCRRMEIFVESVELLQERKDMYK